MFAVIPDLTEIVRHSLKITCLAWFLIVPLAVEMDELIR